MSNLKNENNNIEEDLDYWEIFQSETDDTRNLILDYLVKKCDNHNQKDFPDFISFEKLDENKNYHFDNCNKYLFETERRRKPFKNGKLLYFHHPCKEFKEKFNCVKGDICQFSHNQLEIKFHPNSYKKEMCNTSCCDRNKRYCYKSHRVQDLRYFPFSRKNCMNYNSANNKNENFFIDFNNKKKSYKNIELDKRQPASDKAKIPSDDKEEMLNKLNFDIKNLLDELDLDQLEDEEEKKEYNEDDLQEIGSIF